MMLWPNAPRSPLENPVETPREVARRLIAEVAAEHGVSAKELLGRDLRRVIAHPRHEAIARIRDELGWSTPQIGRLFGRDHSTVIYALGWRERREKAVEKRLRRGRAAE